MIGNLERFLHGLRWKTPCLDWLLNDGERVVVIRVVKDPSCPLTMPAGCSKALGATGTMGTRAREGRDTFPCRTGRSGSRRDILQNSKGIIDISESNN